MDMESAVPRPTVFSTGVNRTSARCEDVIFVFQTLTYSPYLKLTQNPLFQTHSLNFQETLLPN